MVTVTAWGVGPSDISFSLNDFFPKGKRAKLFYYRVSWDHVDERLFLGWLELSLGPEVKMIFVQKFSKHESFGKKHSKSIHRSESRWLATPKRWRFVRGHEKPRRMGVAPSTFQVV